MSFFARLKDYPGRRISAWDTVHDQFVYVVTIITLQGTKGFVKTECIPYFPQ